MVLQLKPNFISLVQAIEAWMMRTMSNNNIQKGVGMTRNQLTYWQNVETKRSNVAREKETHRANKAQEIELNRHNTTVEVETERHNRATELLTKQQLDESARHNLATEALSSAQLSETIRANQAREYLTSVQNDIGYGNLNIASRNADTNRMNAETNRYSAAELARHNLATEGFNLLSLQEKTRYDNLSIINDSRRVNETERHNLASEDNDRLRNAIAEQQAQSQSRRATEDARHNIETELENYRHNTTVEPSQNYERWANTLRTLLNIRNDKSNSDANVLRSTIPFINLLGGAS